MEILLCSVRPVTMLLAGFSVGLVFGQILAWFWKRE